MEVCHLCQDLRLIVTGREHRNYVKHCQDLSALQTSSITCGLCRLMLSRIDLSLADDLPSWVKRYLLEASIVVIHDRSHQRNIICPRLCFTGPDEWGFSPPSPIKRLDYLWDSAGIMDNIYSTDWKYYLLSSLAAVDDDNERYIGKPLWDVNRSQKLHERLKFAKSELKNCLANHKHCRNLSSSSPKHPPQLPTRVIDVWYLPKWHLSKTHDAKARLIRSNGSKAHYTALSYCWGGGKTEESTIQELKQGIQPSKLAKTYEDAIHITRSLGIRYLWIDALCIMQNNHAEREAEIASMANIYLNAQVSISASASTSLHGGCVQRVDPPLHVAFSADKKLPSNKPLRGSKNPFHQYRVRNSPQKTTQQKAYIRPSPRYGQNVLRSHLTTRGWTLQEDLIPLRTIYCAHDEMYWRCGEWTTTEDGVIDWPPGNNQSFFYYGAFYDDYGLAFDQHYSTRLKGWTRGLLSGERKSIDLWCQVINDFTSRTLTYPTDRLRAVVGLINDQNVDDIDHHLAGLWREDLMFGLFWKVHPSSRDLNLPAVGIPSWSWISFNGQIEYQKRRCPSPVRISQCFDFVDAIMKWSGKALTSELKEATLELDASLQHLSVYVRQPGHDIDIQEASWTYGVYLRATVFSCTAKPTRVLQDDIISGDLPSQWDFMSRRKVDAQLDRMLEEYAGPMYAMHLSSSKDIVTFLLLAPTRKKDDEYCRMGLGSVSSDRGLFEGVSKRRITLV